MPFSFQTVPISEIDRNDTTFQISTDPNISGLAASIASVGLLTPLILRRSRPRYTIVSGFRRIAACLSLNQSAMPARVLSDDRSDLECAGMAVSENALQRPLNLIERSRALLLLSPRFRNSVELSAASATFGMPETPAMIDKLLPLCGLSDPIQAGIIDGTISLSMAQELGRFGPEARSPLADLLLSMKMSLSKQREVLTMIQEISLKEGTSIQDLLAETGIAAIITDQDSERNVKIGRLRDLLKKRRYPAIHAAEGKTAALIRSLKLREQMKLVPPENLEGTEFSLTLRFHDIPALRCLHQFIGELLDRPELERLISKDF